MLHILYIGLIICPSYLTNVSFDQMLPFGGQGSNQAMEDGGALGYLLRGVEDAKAIPSRLAIFDKVRKKRASRVQTLSKVRVGREKEVEQELKKYAENADAGKHYEQPDNGVEKSVLTQLTSVVPGSFPERIAHDFGYVFALCMWTDENSLMLLPDSMCLVDVRRC